MITNDVENYPGYPNGIMGPEMMADFQKQAERFGTELHYGVHISKVELSSEGGIHKLWADNGDEIHAHTIIIATGASAKWLGIPSEQKLMNRGVSACAVCDGFFFKGKEVAIVGGGDTACEEASYLAKLCPKVHMLVRRSELRASKIMQDRVMKKENIQIHWNSQVQEVLGEEEVTGIRIEDGRDGSTRELSVSALFIAIGHKPNTDLFKGVLDMDETGYLITKPDSTKTNIPGVFASGDAQDKIYRQAVTAAGTGCMAALDAEHYLTEKGLV